MLWVAGGCSTVKLYNRIRGDRIRGVQKVTLPYLKPYKQLPITITFDYATVHCQCAAKASQALLFLGKN